jgi:long-chain acyl-CoA synthetase
MNKPGHFIHPNETTREITVPDLSIFHLLERSVSKYPTNDAVIDGECKLTFSELRDCSEYFAAALHNRGFKKGDRLALMLLNSIEYVIAFFAVHRLGGTIVQVNPMYQPQELEYILQDSEATWFIGRQEEKKKLHKIELDDQFTAIFVDTEVKDSFYALINEKLNGLPIVNIHSKEDVAVLQYTGGTTGTPKGVMLTHFNIVANLSQTYAYGEEVYSEPGHSLLGVAPMFHAMGMTNMNLCLFIGGTYIAVKRFQIDNVIELIRKHRPTLFLGSPTMYIALLNYPDLQDNDLQSFKLCVCGSAPMPIEVIKKFKRATSALFVEGYGLSEATTSSNRNPLIGEKKVGSIGIPLPNTEVKIVDIDSGIREVPGGESGELIIKGPQVMKGYWKKTEETNNAIRDGWLYTGDLAIKDEDGYFYIVGRKKDMIIAGGYNIYPVEIENVIYEHPSVREACVFGVPDSYRGETVKAVLVVNQTTVEEEIKSWCTERLAKYKVPRIIEFRDELPKSTVGKILRRKLVEEEQDNSKT